MVYKNRKNYNKINPNLLAKSEKEEKSVGRKCVPRLNMAIPNPVLEIISMEPFIMDGILMLHLHT